ncbi:MAG: 16S rRNA (guanine(966)-N(2))-methyltransferase RsmD [Desulfobacterota bacterium]|jgi:16S rRNA (guanine966-N2)-methyltransferase|nr:16S rRNA (guanine(966)-N(2))-methyltransferase RsmD [Thermodesulfobacteriota bacterium]
MRITGGRLRGRRLASFKGLEIRPTSDRVREAIFDLLGHDLTGEKVVDLFAGTGSLGIEALSRGAEWALFVDDSPKALELIAKNLALCGLQSQGVLVRKDLMRGFPRRHRAAEEKADLAFVDPPYRKNMILAVLEELAGLNLLAPEATVVAQSEQKEVLPPGVGCLHGVKSRVYGDTRITLYRNEGEL